MKIEREKVAQLFIHSSASIRQAVDRINENGKGLAALVVDDEQRLVDIVTDGDVRRAILQGTSLDEHVSVLTNRKRGDNFPKPVTASIGLPKDEIVRLMRTKGIDQLPLLDDSGRVMNLVKLSDIVTETEPVFQAMVMAGGFGTRLSPLTADTPKPMLPVGNRPLLELTIDNLKSAGIRKVNVTTHFRPEKIRDHFGDGSAFGVEISYLNEDTPLGTAGALSMIGKIDEPILLINGDILTKVDFRAMMRFHREQQSQLTVAVRQYDIKVPFGVLECDGPVVTSVREKPTLNLFVSAGIYLLEPDVCRLIPSGKRYDMPDLVNQMIAEKRQVASFPVVEYWLDIGQHFDYAQAQEDIEAGVLGAPSDPVV